jgi:hypothetical protein
MIICNLVKMDIILYVKEWTIVQDRSKPAYEFSNLLEPHKYAGTGMN